MVPSSMVVSARVRKAIETLFSFFFFFFSSNEFLVPLLFVSKMPSVIIKSKGGSTLATLKVDSSVRTAYNSRMREGR